MSKTKFSLSKTGSNWVAVPTGSISKNQSVSRQKMENAVSASKDASFGMSNSKICLIFKLDDKSSNNVFKGFFFKISPRRCFTSNFFPSGIFDGHHGTIVKKNPNKTFL